MPRRLDPVIREQARQLRKAMTEPERLLWECLRGRKLGVRVRRQHPIGPYIVDFAVVARRVVIEVDGPTHHDRPAELVREAELYERGWQVVRVTNDEVRSDFEAVIERIRRVLR